MPFACVLISDITGSTQLYEAENDIDALDQITVVLNRMRQIIEQFDGHCVKSQGDDVLSYFDQPDSAFHAAQTMIHEDWYGALKTQLAMIGEMQLKGKKDPTRVYSCSAVDMSDKTVITVIPRNGQTKQTEAARLTYNDQNWRIGEGEALAIGRSDDNDIVMEHAWVSRKHAVVSVRRGQLEFTDHSSTGSVVQTDEGKEISIHRRATLLNGSGLIFLGSGVRKERSSALTFDTQDMRLQYASD